MVIMRELNKGSGIESEPCSSLNPERKIDVIQRSLPYLVLPN